MAIMAYNYFSGRALFLSATPAGRRRARKAKTFSPCYSLPAALPINRRRSSDRACALASRYLSVPFPSFLLSPLPLPLSTSESRRASRQRASEMTGAAVRSGTITATITAERRDASGAPFARYKYARGRREAFYARCAAPLMQRTLDRGSTSRAFH